MPMTKFTMSDDESAEFRALAEEGETRGLWDRLATSMGFDGQTVQQIKNDPPAPITFKAEKRDVPLDEAVQQLKASVQKKDPQPDISDAAHNAMVERIEDTAVAPLGLTGLVNDLRDAVLTQVKQIELPWGKTPQTRQREIAAAVEHACGELVRGAVELLAADGQQGVRVLLTKIDIGDDIKITGKVKCFNPDEENAAVDLLHKARGSNVILTVATKDTYIDPDRPASTDEDEPPLAFDNERSADDSDLAAGGDTEEATGD